jgi:nucleoside-triphosphatase THEP1
MEAMENETEVLSIGKFLFSKTSFDKAQQIIDNAMDKKGWLIIDEIGPLEMRREGFYEILNEVLRHQPEKQKILLVIRNGMLENVNGFFDLTNATVIYNVSGLP